jgi:hypothetical protein
MCSAPEDQIDTVMMQQIEQQANISLRLRTIAGLVDRSPALFRQSPRQTIMRGMLS